MVRLAFNTCNKITPSQSNLPPVEPVVPEYPFQHVCIDYLTLKGVSYGVFVDRYTGWPGVITGTYASDMATFIAKLCELANACAELGVKQVKRMLRTMWGHMEP